MEREHIVLQRPLPPGMTRMPFSDAVRAGDTIYISGRIGIDPETMLPPQDVSAEAELLMQDLQNVLRAAQLTMNDLVMVQIFSPDVAHFSAFNAVYVRYFGEHLPARAFIGSGALLFGAKFELTAIAVR